MLYNWTKLKVFLLFNLKVQVHIYNYPNFAYHQNKIIDT